MCGIAGIFQFNGQGSHTVDSLRDMISVMDHRGPDEEGVYVDRWVGLAQKRLSIIDLSSGSQPIHNEDQTMWIIFNGEVFNYIELRKELAGKGHRFLTTSDTEVILHLYEEKGPDCVNDLNGQFAFAIWDSTRKQLFLARDRVGIRPLHYAVHDGRLIFASEIKSIFSVNGVPREIDPVALDETFTFWTTLPGRTAFKGILELPPGHHMTVTPERTVIERFWDVPLRPADEYLDLSPGDISSEVKRLLLDATRLRLRADVPVGTYLSGGIDSSGITSLVVNNFDSDVRTFGIRFEEGKFDEGTHQREMVQYLNANHKEIVAGNRQIGDSLQDVVWHTERPLLRTAPVPLYLLSGLVNQSGLKVVLTGEGADEVFGGYNIFREAKVREFWSRQPQSKTRPELIARLYPYIFGNPKLKSTLQSFFAKGLDRVNDPLFSHLIRWENTSKTKTFFSQDLLRRVGDYDGCEQLRKLLPEDFLKLDVLSRAQYLETRVFLSNYLLSSQGDRMAMAHSVEIRLPYLDPNVIEFMGRVPPKWKVLGLNEKFILKETYKGMLPESILKRAKHPYRAPIRESLITDGNRDFIEDLTSENAVKNAGLFDPVKVRKLLEKVRRTESTGETESMALVGILTSQMLSRMYVDEFHSYSTARRRRTDRCTAYDHLETRKGGN